MNDVCVCNGLFLQLEFKCLLPLSGKRLPLFPKLDSYPAAVTGNMVPAPLVGAQMYRTQVVFPY